MVRLAASKWSASRDQENRADDDPDRAHPAKQ